MLSSEKFVNWNCKKIWVVSYGDRLVKRLKLTHKTTPEEDSHLSNPNEDWLRKSMIINFNFLRNLKFENIADVLGNYWRCCCFHGIWSQMRNSCKWFSTYSIVIGMTKRSFYCLYLLVWRKELCALLGGRLNLISYVHRYTW